MPEIIFKKRRGIVLDLFTVLWMYSTSSSLSAFFKSYNVTPSPDICDSYARICDFIDKNAKELKPFFVKSVNAPDEGSIFHKMTQMLMTQEELLIRDVLNYFRKMSPQFFLAEIFRITEGQPESEREKYLDIVNSHAAVMRFIKSQNYTVREKRAIRYFYEDGEFAYKEFISFIEKLYYVIDGEYKVNDERISRYTEWLKGRLIPDREDYLLESEEFTSRISALGEKIIVTVSMFPPYSLNRLTGKNLSVLCFGIGAYSQYAESCYKKQDYLKDNHCEMRTNVILSLAAGPKRLVDMADELGTSSADISYHIGVLEKNSFVKRVRINGKEHFELIKNGFDFIEKRKDDLKKSEMLSNG
ncbi:MAG: winged helix-turn-helix transcriptional regulator [Clostridia bacterium]|nr:winged helix-turn-helix transcriptional regulator [Clostridia bacterium]